MTIRQAIMLHSSIGMALFWGSCELERWASIRAQSFTAFETLKGMILASLFWPIFIIQSSAQFPMLMMVNAMLSGIVVGGIIRSVLP